MMDSMKAEMLEPMKAVKKVLNLDYMMGRP